MRHNLRLVMPLALALAVACGGTKTEPPAATAKAAPAADLTDAGAVEGVISYAGSDPDSKIDLSADPTCQELHDSPVETQTVVGDGEGHLGNVFVYVKQGLEGESFPVPKEPNVLEQKGCMYVPHVSGMMVGQELLVRNDDPTLHNVHAHPDTNREFNQGQPFQGMEMTRTFDRPELMMPFKCDVHPWMRAYVNVVDNPEFAVSAADGRFSIDKLPPGDYVLEAVHESLGRRTAKVSVQPHQTVRVDFDFTPAD